MNSDRRPADPPRGPIQEWEWQAVADELRRLAAVRDAGTERIRLADDVRRGWEDGDVDLVATLSAHMESAFAPVSALEGLAASRQLVELLGRVEWLVVRACREDGESWEAIGAALGTSAEQAAAAYAAAVEATERHSPAAEDPGSRSKLAR